MNEGDQPVVEIVLTRRALECLDDIEAHSLRNWGRDVTDRYLQDLQSGLDRLAAAPQLLRNESAISRTFLAYRVKKHLIVCSRTDRQIVVLTLLHTSMNAKLRLTRLKPTLMRELQALQQRLNSALDDQRKEQP